MVPGLLIRSLVKIATECPQSSERGIMQFKGEVFNQAQDIPGHLAHSILLSGESHMGPLVPEYFDVSGLEPVPACHD